MNEVEYTLVTEGKPKWHCWFGFHQWRWGNIIEGLWQERRCIHCARIKRTTIL